MTILPKNFEKKKSIKLTIVSVGVKVKKLDQRIAIYREG